MKFGWDESNNMTWVTTLKVLIIKTKNPNQNCWRVNLCYQRIQQNNKSKPKLKYIYIYIYILLLHVMKDPLEMISMRYIQIEGKKYI